MSATSGQEEQPDHLVFVVHGVGDPQPADALTSLVDSYCVVAEAKPAGPRLTSAREDKTEGRPLGDLVRTFPVNQIDTIDNTTKQRTRFVEIYWGDLSRVKGTAGGLLMGTLDLVFGLRHVAGAAHFEIRELLLGTWLRPLARFASWLGWVTQWLIRGPLLALNIFAAILVALVIIDATTRVPLSAAEVAVVEAGRIDRSLLMHGPCAHYLGSAGSLISDTLRLTPEAVYCTSGTTGILISGAIAAVLGIASLLMAISRGWSASLAASLTASGLAGVVWAQVSGASDTTYATFVEDLTSVLSLGAAVMGALVVAMLVLSAAAWLLARAVPRDKRLPLRRALTVVNVCTTLSAALFVLFLMVAWAAVSRQIDIPVLAKRIEGGLHLFIVVWATFVAIGLAYGLISFRGWLGKRRYKGPRTARFPRFIVGWPAVTAILLSALLWTVAFLPTVVSLECNQGQRVWYSLWICDLLGERSSDLRAWVLNVAQGIDDFVSLAVMASIGAVILLFAARAQFGTALDIVLDVQSHFSLNFAPGKGWRWLFQRAESKQYAVWQTIVRRFCAVVEGSLAGTPSPVKRVSVLAHSQGTMIALEGLKVISIDRKGDFPSNVAALVPPSRYEGLRISLVTMGCPYSHLYKYYFPRKYKLCKASSSLVSTWTNFYRPDDFVGRGIRGERQAIRSRNVEIAPRGHVNYWADRDVLTQLFKGDKPQ